VLFGLDRFIPVVETLTLNLDATFQAVEVLIGVVLVVVGFFRNKDRFNLPKND
jgi:hypothetical protein